MDTVGAIRYGSFSKFLIFLFDLLDWMIDKPQVYWEAGMCFGILRNFKDHFQHLQITLTNTIEYFLLPGNRGQTACYSAFLLAFLWHKPMIWRTSILFSLSVVFRSAILIKIQFCRHLFWNCFFQFLSVCFGLELTSSLGCIICAKYCTDN